MVCIKNGTVIARDSLITQNKSMEIKIDKLTKGNRGNMFTIGAYFYENGFKSFVHSNISLLPIYWRVNMSNKNGLI